jgi:hypothetical protein
VNKKDAFNAWIDKRKREGFVTIIAPESFGGGWDAALEAAENEIDKCRYDAPDTPDDYLRGLDSASNAVGELRE